MNALPTPPALIKRRIVYIDEQVQKRLLVALVALEILLVAGALWMLYLQLNGVVEANLYRVHLSEKTRIYPLLLKTALFGLSGLVVINIAALWMANHVWARHVNAILEPLNLLVTRSREMDFSADAPTEISHEVVTLGLRWRERERQRLARLRDEIAKLDSHAGDTERTRASLEAIRALLPDK